VACEHDSGLNRWPITVRYSRKRHGCRATDFGDRGVGLTVNSCRTSAGDNRAMPADAHPRGGDHPPHPRGTPTRPAVQNCASATPSAAGCASPPRGTSRGPWNGPCAGPTSRWRSPPASTRTRSSRMPGAPHRAWRARPSTSRSVTDLAVDPERVRARSPRRGAARGSRRPRGRAGRPGCSLADRLEASEWHVVSPGGRPWHEVTAAVTHTCACARRGDVTRTFKTGPATFDTRKRRAGDGCLRCRRRGVCDTAHGRSAHHTAVRPDDVLTALARSDWLRASGPPRVTRLAQGPLGRRNCCRWPIRWLPTRRPSVPDR
jgi:hypothetical protein